MKGGGSWVSFGTEKYAKRYRWSVILNDWHVLQAGMKEHSLPHLMMEICM